MKKNSFIEKLILYDNGDKKTQLQDNNHIKFSSILNAQYMNDDNFECEPQNMKERIALIMCSSGTTGLPKGVQITQFNMLLVTAQIRYTNLFEFVFGR